MKLHSLLLVIQGLNSLIPTLRTISLNLRKLRKGIEKCSRKDLCRTMRLKSSKKNGKITPVLYDASVYMDKSGDVIGISAAARDTTERKRMEAELESIARLPQENPNPVIRLNQGSIINYANPADQMLLAYWGSTINQKAPSTIIDIVVAALDDGVQRKFECTYASNAYFITLTPFPKAGYVNLYGRDITEQKKQKKC